MKYVLEIKPECEDSFKGVMILGAKDSDLFVDTLAVENLEELNSDYINEHFGDLQEQAYQKGFEDGKEGFDDGYQKGYCDALKKHCAICQDKDDAYQRGLEDGKAVHERGCEGCLWEGNRCVACGAVEISQKG